MVAPLLSSSFFFPFYFSYEGFSIYLQWSTKVSSTSSSEVIAFFPFSSDGIILGLHFPFTFLNLSPFLAYLKTLCLMTLLHWNNLNLVLFVGPHQCFLYSVLTILSSLSHSSFHHATGGFLFVSGDVLGMDLSAAPYIVSTRHPYDSSTVSWSCTFVVILASFWKLVQLALPMLHLCCCLMESSLSSSKIMGKWSLPLSLYSLLHLFSRAIVVLVSVRFIVNFLPSNAL